MTLITVYHGGGVVKRCDARCHNAKNTKCQCVCGGRFHGKGAGMYELFEAIKQTADEFIPELEKQGIDIKPLRGIIGLFGPPLGWYKETSLFNQEVTSAGTKDIEAGDTFSEKP